MIGTERINVHVKTHSTGEKWESLQRAGTRVIRTTAEIGAGLLMIYGTFSALVQGSNFMEDRARERRCPVEIPTRRYYDVPKLEQILVSDQEAPYYKNNFVLIPLKTPNTTPLGEAIESGNLVKTAKLTSDSGLSLNLKAQMIAETYRRNFDAQFYLAEGRYTPGMGCAELIAHNLTR